MGLHIRVQFKHNTADTFPLSKLASRLPINIFHALRDPAAESDSPSVINWADPTHHRSRHIITFPEPLSNPGFLSSLSVTPAYSELRENHTIPIHGLSTNLRTVEASKAFSFRTLIIGMQWWR